MDWFERITGFKETGYEATRRQLEVEGNQLRSRVNGNSYSIGKLELVSLRNRSPPLRKAASLIICMA